MLLLCHSFLEFVKRWNRSFLAIVDTCLWWKKKAAWTLFGNPTFKPWVFSGTMIIIITTFTVFVFLMANLTSFWHKITGFELFKISTYLISFILWVVIIDVLFIQGLVSWFYAIYFHRYFLFFCFGFLTCYQNWWAQIPIF